MSRNKTAWKVLSVLLFTHFSVTAAAEGAGSMSQHHSMPPHPHAQTRGPSSEQRLKLGIAFRTLSQQDLDSRSLEYGLLIERVKPGSVAQNAGLQPGDVITRIDSRPVYASARLHHLLRQASGKTEIEYVRDGSAAIAEAEFTAPGPHARAAVGIRIQAMTEQLKEAFGTEGGQGVLVSGVEQEAAAAASGLQAGDVLVAIAGNPIAKTRDVKRLLRQFQPGDKVQLDLVREREPMSVEVVLGAAVKPGMSHRYHPYSHPGHGYWHHGWKHDRRGATPRYRCHKPYPHGR